MIGANNLKVVVFINLLFLYSCLLVLLDIDLVYV